MLFRNKGLGANLTFETRFCASERCEPPQPFSENVHTDLGSRRLGSASVGSNRRDSLRISLFDCSLSEVCARGETQHTAAVRPDHLVAKIERRARAHQPFGSSNQSLRPAEKTARPRRRKISRGIRRPKQELPFDRESFTYTSNTPMVDSPHSTSGELNE
jgi:hypothetical protein